jgi:predicted transcriptional regulator
MSERLTIDLPDEIYQRFQRLARLSNREIAEVLSDTLQRFLPVLDRESEFEESISSLSDERILALTQLEMEREEDRRLSELLEQQQARDLTLSERLELQTLMGVYQAGLLRKATALSEAVKRELIAPLSDG